MYTMNKELIKIFLACFFLTFVSISVNTTYAKNTPIERRVYYLDATYSMVSNKLWEPCKTNLIKAIENIEDVNTELVVVVFADDRNPTKKIWRKWEEKATNYGKTILINNIKNLANPVKSSMTNLYDPWVDFYSEAKIDRVNYMFLMTDGGHEQGGNFFKAIDQWNDKTYPLTYGFFVELTDNVGSNEITARNKARIHIDKQKERLWRVSTADVNINLIRLEESATFNVRSDKFIDIPLFFSGKEKTCIKGLKFEFINNPNFKVVKADITEDNIRVFIKSNIDIHNYPTNSNIPLAVKLNYNDKTFLLTNNVNIKCFNKKERILLLSESKIRGEVKHYDTFAWIKSKTTPCHTKIDLNFNQDALSDSETFVEFELIAIDGNGKILPTSSMIITSQEGICKNNKIRINPTNKELTLSLSFPDGTEPDVYNVYLKPVNYHLDRIGNIELNESTIQYPLSWRVNYTHIMNPLAKMLMWLGVIIVLGLVFWFVILRPQLYPHFQTFRKRVLIKKDGIIVSQFNVDFKGYKQVVFSTKEYPQSILSKIFTGRIKTVVNPIFEESIIFLPRKKKKAIAKGAGYIFTPNPIPQNGNAKIIAPAKKIEITL